MTIDEAIEKLTTLKRSGALDGDPWGVLAIELAIGAIQEIAQMRLLYISPIAELLPGETVESKARKGEMNEPANTE